MDKKLMISVFAFIILLAGALYFGKGNTVVSSSESESISKKVTNLIEKEEAAFGGLRNIFQELMG